MGLFYSYRMSTLFIECVFSVIMLHFENIETMRNIMFNLKSVAIISLIGFSAYAYKNKSPSNAETETVKVQQTSVQHEREDIVYQDIDYNNFLSKPKEVSPKTMRYENVNRARSNTIAIQKHFDQEKFASINNRQDRKYNGLEYSNENTYIEEELEFPDGNIARTEYEKYIATKKDRLAAEDVFSDDKHYSCSSEELGLDPKKYDSISLEPPSYDSNRNMSYFN